MGQAYEINNQKTHSVMNKGTEDRITFIFDYFPPEQLAGHERHIGESKPNLKEAR